MAPFGVAADAHDAGLVPLRWACVTSTRLMLMMLGVLCWEWPLLHLESRLMLMMLGLLCWERPLLTLEPRLILMDAGLVVLRVAIGVCGIAADAHDAGRCCVESGHWCLWNRG